LSRTLAYMGFLEQARAASQKALEQARAGKNPQTLAYMLTLGFLSEWAFRRPTELLRQARELMTVAEEQRFPQYLTAGRAAYGWCLVKSGEMQKGLDLLAGSFGNTQTGTRLYEPFRLALVADAWGAAGQPQTGLNSLDEAFEMMEVTDERWAEAELHRVRGELLAAVGDTRAAARSFGTALRVAEGQKAKTWELRAAASLARLWRQEGRHADAQALLRPVVEWFTEGLDTALFDEVSPLL
jgi:predicted ATPase